MSGYTDASYGGQAEVPSAESSLVSQFFDSSRDLTSAN